MVKIVVEVNKQCVASSVWLVVWLACVARSHLPSTVQVLIREEEQRVKQPSEGCDQIVGSG